MNSHYRFELATFQPDELSITSAFLRKVFPKAKHLLPGYLAWNYRDGPDGQAIGFNAYAGDTLVGHMVALPIAAKIDGGATSGIILQNCAVHRDHRGKKLQTHISEHIFDEAARRGHAFVLAVGNGFSTGPLLTRRFKLLKALDARIGFGAPRPAATAQDASFERIWSEDSLRWRSANPASRSAIRNGHLLASTPWPGISAILHEQAGLPETDTAMPGPLRVWIGLHPTLDWSRSASVPIPDRLRPSPLNLVIRPLQSADVYPDPARLVFRAADFDAF